MEKAQIDCAFLNGEEVLGINASEYLTFFAYGEYIF